MNKDKILYWAGWAGIMIMSLWIVLRIMQVVTSKNLLLLGALITMAVTYRNLIKIKETMDSIINRSKL